MPTVPQYSPGEVGYGGGVSARQDVQAPAGSFGIDPGAVAAVGQGVDTAAKYLDAYQQQQDEARAMAISRPVATQYRQALYGSDDGSQPGYLALSGAQALNGREGITTQLTKARDDALAQAAGFNPRVRALVEKTLQSGFDSTMNSVAQHANTQGIKYANDETAAQAALEGDNYAAAFRFDPVGAQAHFQTGEIYTRRLAVQQGAGPEQEELAVQKYRTQAFSNVIDSYLNDPKGGALQAQGYFAANRSMMDAKTATAYEQKIADAVDTQKASNGALGAASYGLSAGPSGAPITGTVPDAVRIAAQKYGVDPSVAVATLLMENPRMDPKAKSPHSSSYGLLQVSDDTWKKYGGTPQNRDDPQAQVDIGVQVMAHTATLLRNHLGRAPTASEMYLTYQQGDGGGPALLTADPSANAISVLEPIYERQYGPTKGAALARQAIVNNGGSAQMTAGQFVAHFSGLTAQKMAAAGRAVGPALNSTSGDVSNLPTDRETFFQHALQLSGVDATNPNSVAKVRAASDAQYNRLHGDLEARQSAAADVVDRSFAGPNPPTQVSDIPSATWNSLSGAKQKSITEVLAHAGEQGPYAKSSDPVTFQALSDLHASGRGQLATVDMTKYLGKLSKGDYDTVLGWKRDELTPDPEKKARQVTLGTVSSVANTLAEAAGLGGKQHVEDRAQLSVALQRKVDDFRTQNPGKEPDDKAIHAMADGLLLNGSWKGEPGVFGAPTVRGPLYKAPVGAQITFTVPKPAYDKIVASYARNRPGQPPSGAEIRAAYFRGHAAGMFQ